METHKLTAQDQLLPSLGKGAPQPTDTKQKGAPQPTDTKQKQQTEDSSNPTLKPAPPGKSQSSNYQCHALGTARNLLPP